MALISQGPFGQTSGKFGSVEVAQKGGRGVLKVQKVKRGARTPNVVSAQASNAEKVARWRGLSVDQKAAWKTAAAQRPRPDRFGNMRNLNGFQLFMTLPQNWWGVEFVSWQDVPPIKSMAHPSYLYVSDVHAHQIKINVVGWSPDPNQYAILYVGRFREADSRANQRTWVRLPMVWVYQDPVDFTAAMALRKMSLVVGETVRLKLVLYGDQSWPTEVMNSSFTVT